MKYIGNTAPILTVLVVSPGAVGRVHCTGGDEDGGGLWTVISSVDSVTSSSKSESLIHVFFGSVTLSVIYTCHTIWHGVYIHLLALVIWDLASLLAMSNRTTHGYVDLAKSHDT